MSQSKSLIRVWLSAALVLFCLPYAQAEEEGAIEEVVVTGSYLKKTTADSPSPLSVISRADIEEIGAMDIKDIVRNLTYASGSLGGSSSPFFGGDSSTGGASLNLRNLGNGATLVLVNGKRTVNTDFDLVGSAYVNVQNFIPSVAVERVEILKDGASALYGSDAVAGVVNFITRQDFEGVEFSIDYATDTETKEQDDITVSMIMGVSGDRGNITASASYLDRGELNIGHRYSTYGKSGLSTFGQPGRYVPLAGVTPDVDSYFVPGGSTSFGQGADPDCDIAAAYDGPFGVQGNVNGLCIYDFSSFFALVQPDESWKFHVDGNFALTDNIELFGSASYSDSYTYRNNSLYPDVNFAIVGADNFGVQLDAARRGINPIPYLALQRMMGGTVNSTIEDRPVNTISTYERSYFSTNVGMTIDFENSWSLTASIGHSEAQFMSTNPSDTITSNVNAAYVGLGGPGCDTINGSPGSGNLGTGNCYYYNPFGTSMFDPVTGAKWNTADTSPWAADPTLTVQEAARKYQNPDELYLWMQGEIASQITRDQTVVDVVLAGDIFEMANGNAGLAVGFQYRKDESRSDFDTISNNNNFKFIYGAQDWDNEATTYAVFAELYVPFASWGELQFATRYEDFDELGESTVDPKLTLLLRPTDSLSIRASGGTSFRVGSLLQTGGKNTALLNSSDPVSGTGGLAFRPTLTTGNPDLVPEESTMWNIGLSWIPTDGPLEGLSVDFDYYNYDYQDLISREGHQDLINQDNALRCPNGLNADPTAGPLCGVSDQDGDGVNEFYSVGEGIPDKVIRREDGGLLRTEAVYFNAPSLETSGIDATITYEWTTENMGMWRAQVSGSYTLDYDIVTDSGTKIDGVGSRNNGNSIGRPLPEFKVNSSLRWIYDRHTIIATVRHIDGYTDDTAQSALRGAFGFFAPEIDSHTEFDLQYSVQLPGIGFFGNGANFTLGAKNLTNEEPPVVNVDGGYDYFTHDPRGRIIYGRLTLAL